MKLKVQEIKRYLEIKKIPYEYEGNERLIINGFSSLSHVKNGSITWIKNISEDILESLIGNKDLLIVCNKIKKNMHSSNFNCIFCEQPKEVFFSILSEFFEKKKEFNIADTAVINTSKIGNNCCIGHHSFIDADVTIGDNVQIGHNVTILNQVSIGDNTIIGSGSVIGGDGFGYYKDKNNINIKVPHFGGVWIGKNVEIGSNTCIDRGTIDDTFIEDFVKIDNLCHIAHNVCIGAKSKVVALSLLAGSSSLGESVYIAPGTLVKNQIKIEENCVAGMGSMILKNVGKGKVLIGAPAKVLRDVTEEDLKL